MKCRRKQAAAILVMTSVVIFLSYGAQASAAEKDVTHLLQVEYGGFRLDHVSGSIVQRIRLRNSSSDPISGDLAVYLDGLTPGVTVANSDHELIKRLPKRPESPNAGVVPIRTINLSPGKTTDIQVRFDNPSRTPIRYRAVVYDTTQ